MLMQYNIRLLLKPSFFVILLRYVLTCNAHLRRSKPSSRYVFKRDQLARFARALHYVKILDFERSPLH